MTILAKVKKIIDFLRKAYGKPRRFRRSDPVDELILTVLSQNTTDRNSHRAFGALKRRFSSWEELLKTNRKAISREIKSAGLANIKSNRIKGILTEIKRREGRITLEGLRDSSLNDSLEYLRSLKGVGPKTAACVLLFSFNKPVMPVDTHIFRVTKRLGLIDEDLDIDKAHEVLSSIIPKDLIYDFHLGIIEHGRKACKAQIPRCGICLLYGLCEFKSKAFFKRRMKG